MNLHEQKRRVALLSAQVYAEAARAALHRNTIRDWQQRAFGDANALAWSFAAGVLWGLSTPPGKAAGSSSNGLRRAFMSSINASLFAWRMANVKTP
jgi:hypothetical protein